jgi:hypothetical protein
MRFGNAIYLLVVGLFNELQYLALPVGGSANNKVTM